VLPSLEKTCAKEGQSGARRKLNEITALSHRTVPICIIQAIHRR